LNLLVYLNSDWDESWGGNLGLWSNESPESPGSLEKEIWPKFNRAVIFDTTQNSWHGLPEPIQCPESQFRKSLAVYYLIDPSCDVDSRGKALFAPTEDQKQNVNVLELIKKRSMTTSAADVYKTDVDDR